MDPCLAGFVDEFTKIGGAADLARTVGRGALKGGRTLKDLVTSDAPGKSALVSGTLSGGLALAANHHDPGAALREAVGFGGGQFLGEGAATGLGMGGPTRTGRFARSGMGWLGGAVLSKRLHELAAKAKGPDRAQEMAERLAELEKAGAFVAHDRPLKRPGERRTNPAVVLERLREKYRKMRKKAGEAKKQITFDGIRLKLEYEPGDVRSGVSKSGEKWERTMHCCYGYVPGTKGAGLDGDAIDIYLAKEPTPGAPVFAIKQLKQDGRLDETKHMLGFESAEAAKECYLGHMPKWAFGAITQMSMDGFRQLVDQLTRKAA